MRLKNKLSTLVLILAALATQKSASMDLSQNALEKKFYKAIESGDAVYVRAMILDSLELRARLFNDPTYANECLDIAIRSAENIRLNMMPLLEESEVTEWLAAYHSCLQTALVLIEFGAQQSHLTPAYQDMLANTKVRKYNSDCPDAAALDQRRKAPKKLKSSRRSAHAKPAYLPKKKNPDQKICTVTCTIS